MISREAKNELTKVFEERQDEILNAVAKAMFEHQVDAARIEFDQAGVGIDDAEQFFLDLAPESDAALVVLGTSYIDTHMTDSWRRNMPGKSKAEYDALFDGSGPLATFSAKIRLAHSLDWISDATNKDLHLLRKIRNLFAHDPYKTSLEDNEIMNLITALDPHGEGKIMEIVSESVGFRVTMPTRLKLHHRMMAICSRTMVEMLAGKIAQTKSVPLEAVIGNYDKGPESLRNALRANARTTLKLLKLYSGAN